MSSPPPKPTSQPASQSQPQVGPVADVVKGSLGLTYAALEGSLPELPEGEWRLSLGVALKPAQACTVNATLTLAEAAVAACARLHVLDEDTGVETSVLGLATGPLSLEPNTKGHTLLLDCKSGAALPPCGWTLQVSADAEVEAAEVPLKPPQQLEDKYAPNQEYTLFRVVMAAEAEKCSAAVHVATSEPSAELSLRVLSVASQEGELAGERGPPPPCLRTAAQRPPWAI